MTKTEQNLENNDSDGDNNNNNNESNNSEGSTDNNNNNNNNENNNSNGSKERGGEAATPSSGSASETEDVSSMSTEDIVRQCGLEPYKQPETQVQQVATNLTLANKERQTALISDVSMFRQSVVPLTFNSREQRAECLQSATQMTGEFKATKSLHSRALSERLTNCTREELEETRKCEEAAAERGFNLINEQQQQQHAQYADEAAVEGSEEARREVAAQAHRRAIDELVKKKLRQSKDVKEARKKVTSAREKLMRLCEPARGGRAPLGEDSFEASEELLDALFGHFLPALREYLRFSQAEVLLIGNHPDWTELDRIHKQVVKFTEDTDLQVLAQMVRDRELMFHIAGMENSGKTNVFNALFLNCDLGITGEGCVTRNCLSVCAPRDKSRRSQHRVSIEVRSLSEGRALGLQPAPSSDWAALGLNSGGPAPEEHVRHTKDFAEADWAAVQAMVERCTATVPLADWIARVEVETPYFTELLPAMRCVATDTPGIQPSDAAHGDLLSAVQVEETARSAVTVLVVSMCDNNSAVPAVRGVIQAARTPEGVFIFLSKLDMKQSDPPGAQEDVHIMTDQLVGTDFDGKGHSVLPEHICCVCPVLYNLERRADSSLSQRERDQRDSLREIVDRKFPLLLRDNIDAARQSLVSFLETSVLRLFAQGAAAAKTMADFSEEAIDAVLRVLPPIASNQVGDTKYIELVQAREKMLKLAEEGCAADEESKEDESQNASATAAGAAETATTSATTAAGTTGAARCNPHWRHLLEESVYRYTDLFYDFIEQRANGYLSVLLRLGLDDFHDMATSLFRVEFNRKGTMGDRMQQIVMKALMDPNLGASVTLDMAEADRLVRRSVFDTLKEQLLITWRDYALSLIKRVLEPVMALYDANGSFKEAIKVNGNEFVEGRRKNILHEFSVAVSKEQLKTYELCLQAFLLHPPDSSLRITATKRLVVERYGLCLDVLDYINEKGSVPNALLLMGVQIARVMKIGITRNRRTQKVQFDIPDKVQVILDLRKGLIKDESQVEALKIDTAYEEILFGKSRSK